MSQYEIMQIIWQHPEGILQKEVAKKMGLVSIDDAQIRSLINKGMIKRIPAAVKTTWILIAKEKPEERLII